MRTVAVFAIFCLVASFAYQTEDEVVVLTDSTFNDAINEFDYALVEFYAPWCGHCKTLAPQYAAAAQQLAKSNPEIKLCKVDATVEKEVAGRFEIKGFPTLKFFTKGNLAPIPYEGGRTTPDIISWLKKRAGPSSVEAKSVEDIEKLIGDNEVIVVYLGAAGSSGYTNFLAVSSTFDDVAFAHSHDQSVLDKYEASGEKIILFKKFDEGKNIHTGSLDQGEIREFINANRYPTVLPFDQKAAQKIFGEGLDVIILLVEKNAAGARAEEAFNAAASELKGKIMLSIARLGEGLGDRLADYIGVAKDTLPAIRVVQPGNNNQKFVYDTEITADNIKSFYNDFRSGKLSAHFKSEPIPENPYDDGVRVVVGKNYKEVVLNDEDDVLMEYYAPWCGHCKTLAPIYSTVGNKLKGVEGIVIGKMDATANEVEGLSIQGFPTLKFYKKGSKSNPIDFNGDRTEEGILEFLKKQSSAKIPHSKPEDIDL